MSLFVCLFVCLLASDYLLVAGRIGEEAEQVKKEAAGTDI